MEEAVNFPSDPVLSDSVQEGKDLQAKLTKLRGQVTTSSLRVEEKAQQFSTKLVHLERWGAGEAARVKGHPVTWSVPV